MFSFSHLDYDFDGISNDSYDRECEFKVPWSCFLSSKNNMNSNWSMHGHCTQMNKS